jgi:hypothetical protein
MYEQFKKTVVSKPKRFSSNIIAERRFTTSIEYPYNVEKGGLEIAE